MDYVVWDLLPGYKYLDDLEEFKYLIWNLKNLKIDPLQDNLEQF